MTTHGFVDGYRCAVACSTDVTIQALELNVEHLIAFRVKPSIAQHIPQLDP